MPSKPRVLLTLKVPDEALAQIKRECAVIQPATWPPTRDAVRDALGDVVGYIGSAQFPFDSDLLDNAQKLRVISNFGVGYDNIDVPAATERGIVVCNTPGVLSDAVADLTMACVLALARRLPASERHVREGRWQSGRPMGLGIDIAGKTLGIVGFGRIGQAVASRAHAFDMQVCYSDVQAIGDAPPGCVHRELDHLLGASDVVSLHTNLTEQTRHLIGARELLLMKPSAFLINTSRGQIVNQPALVEALKQGRIGGAALDVFEREPLPPDDPLLQIDNVILLPHIGSATIETRAAMLNLAIDNLLAALRGDTPPCVVNPEALAVRRGG